MKLLAAVLLLVAAVVLALARADRRLRARDEWQGHGPGAYTQDGTWIEGWWPCTYCGEGHVDRSAAEPGGRCYFRRIDSLRDYPELLPV